MPGSRTAVPATKAVGRRFDRLDALRGAAIVWMVVYHFCFDLNHLGLWRPRQAFFSDPFWTWQRAAIVTLFVFCAGLSMSMALAQGQDWPRFWKRWSQVAACALLVSAGSALMFPNSWIGFGVLHGLAAMLLISRLLVLRLGSAQAPLWLLGALALALPRLVKHRFFDTPFTHWIGLVTRPPITEDWVPVLPWLGVMLWGLAAGRWLLARHPSLLAGELPQALQPLAMLGRWSLSFYMLHQPLLLGALLGGRALAWW